jgi:hypothetical protein
MVALMLKQTHADHISFTKRENSCGPQVLDLPAPFFWMYPLVFC